MGKTSFFEEITLYMKGAAMLIDSRIIAALSRYDEQEREALFFRMGYAKHLMQENQIQQRKMQWQQRKEELGMSNRFIRLCNCFELTEFEEHCFLLSILPMQYDKYRFLTVYLQGDEKPFFTFRTMVQLFEGEYIVDNRIGLVLELQERLSNIFFEAVSKTQPMDSPCILRKQILEFLFTDKVITNEHCMAAFPNSPLYEILYGEAIQERMMRALRANGCFQKIVCLFGGDGVGKRFLVCHCGKALNQPIIFLDMRNRNEEDYYCAFTEAILHKGIPCFYHMEEVSEEQQRNLYEIYYGLSSLFPLLLLGRKRMGDTLNREYIFPYYEFEIPEPTAKQRFLIWKRTVEGLPLSNQIDLTAVSEKFILSPLQIQKAVFEARCKLQTEGISVITEEMLTRSCYWQSGSHLCRIAKKVQTNYVWTDLVLEEQYKQLLYSACDHIKYASTVYTEWGFSEKISYGKNTSILLEGPPGTGKTMAAQVMAKELGLDLYQIDLSQVLSKYIGETEKNLNDIFEDGRKSNCILFFDEMDALFAKRSEVKDSHDRYANIETAFLLQKFEEYDGIIILATNYLNNIDQAFMRRINFIVHFPFPDASARTNIWRAIFPKQMPRSKDIDYEYLGKQFALSGGSIKNTALAAAFLAAAKQEVLDMHHILLSVAQEMTKQGKVFLREDFGIYAYLL